MRLHEIEQILSYLEKNSDGSYDELQVLDAIQYAYDIGFTTGREECHLS